MRVWDFERGLCKIPNFPLGIPNDLQDAVVHAVVRSSFAVAVIAPGRSYTAASTSVTLGSSGLG
ncbi:hypothetical protein J6590_046939 [Homalodisca vitripennis]|nr:hypothetical protein J6590_046939 [Homalodisca vitripennis]